MAVKNGYLEYYRFGRGSPIVLIAGYGTDITSWNRYFLTALAAEHEVIVFNNRNVGGSCVRSDHYTSADLAEDTYQLIQNLRLKKTAVLGISMGGMIGQQLAILHPDKISQLILINTAIAGKQSIHPTPSTEKLMLNLPKNKFHLLLVVVKLFFPASERIQMGVSLAMDRFQPHKYTEIQPGPVMSQQKALLARWVKDNDTAQKIKNLSLPVLILNGDADDIIPPINSLILARTIPHAKLIRWRNGGHAMIYQYPEEIADAVNSFIAKKNFDT